MTRRNATVLAAAGVLALVLAGLYLATRRRPQLAPATSGDLRVQGHTYPDATVDVPAAEETAPLTVLAAGPPVVAAAPVPVAPPAAAARQPAEATEPPLPTWVRVAIVGAALIAFFAVSLIATKGV